MQKTIAYHVMLFSCQSKNPARKRQQWHFQSQLLSYCKTAVPSVCSPRSDVIASLPYIRACEENERLCQAPNRARTQQLSPVEEKAGNTQEDHVERRHDIVRRDETDGFSRSWRSGNAKRRFVQSANSYKVRNTRRIARFHRRMHWSEENRRFGSIRRRWNDKIAAIRNGKNRR